MVAEPTFELETDFFRRGCRFVIGCDEVGRGALAGPVAVGMVVVDQNVGPIPLGLRDSKLLSEKRRDKIAPLCASWVLYSAVGLASAEEIDGLGIVACLGLAGKRALVMLHEQGAHILESTVVLDGTHDWLSPALFTAPALITRAKADRDCASVSAASVIAKVFRDTIMIESGLQAPHYAWASNKGYGSAAHMAAITEYGPSSLHRRSWLKEPSA